MFSKILNTLLVCLVAFTSAWPTAPSLLSRDASAEPIALPATDGVISGNQVAILNVYNASTNTNIIAGSKKCQTKGDIAKLEDGTCYLVNSPDLGIKLSSIVTGCKGNHNIFLSFNMSKLSNF